MEAVKQSNASTLAQFNPKITADQTTPADSDGNNVKTQKELGLMLENTTLYNVSATAVSRKLAALRKAIQ
jgi:flagellar basal body rod protein FlgB